MPPEEAAPLGLSLSWAAPPGVAAFMSTRQGGRSAGAFTGFNLGDHVGDEVAAVMANRRALEQAMGARPVWLRQVHGAQVVDAHEHLTQEPPQADASVTDQPGVACVVQVADCLPVLLAARNGRAVGAAHAGWRGLAAGVLEATLTRLCRLGCCEPDEVVAWLGPCIGPRRFEVGADVLQALSAPEHFTAAARPDGTQRWLADLPGLARQRLRSAGVRSVDGGHWCTVEDPQRFYSYRRDGVTGRLAAAVWKRH